MPNQNDPKKQTKTSVPPPPDPMSALSKASTIGAPQGPWTPLPSPSDSPVEQLAHAILGNARVVSGPGGRSPATSSYTDLAGLVGGGEGGAADAASSPIAHFIGWMRGAPEKGIDHVPLYNVDAPGHPLDRSTVTPTTLQQHNIPFTPPPPPRWEQPTQVTGQGLQVPPSFFNKAAAMGDQTLQGLRQAGQPAPAAGFRSTQDIDQLLGKFGGRGK